MEIKEIVPRLQNEAQSLSRQVPDAEWYLFGSIIRDERLPSDVDLLIVYKNDADANELRRGLMQLSQSFPLHLLLLRKDEETQLNFISKQKASRIFPLDTPT
jgi:predicted nucleotidyltransferase